MADFLNSFSIQRWLELCPQGYLEDTVYGHEESEREPETLLMDDALRTEAIRSTVQLVVGERAALAASSGLINSAPTTQASGSWRHRHSTRPATSKSSPSACTTLASSQPTLKPQSITS